MTLPFVRVLLTGGDGFVAQTLGPMLTASLGPMARVVACGAPRGDWAARWVSLDLTDAVAVRTLVARERPDLVIHLAARSSVAESTDGAAATWRVNFGGSLNLGEAIAATVPTATMLFVSSAEVYGASFNDGPCDETSPLRPLSPYARSKAATEAMLGDVLTPSNRLIVARPANHTGPEQDSRFVIPSFAEQIARIEAGLQPAVVRVGNLSPKRDFLDVRDVAAAYVALLHAAGSQPSRGIFNIASERSIAIRDLLGMMIGQAACPVDIEQDPARVRPSEVPLSKIAAGRIRAATGWRPIRSMAQSITEVIDRQRDRVANAVD